MINRNSTADLLKGIAVFLMIQVHILELFATETIFNSPIGKVLLFFGGPPVAPLFVAILGYFIASSKKETKQLLWRGLKVFLLGMLLNIGLNLHLLISVSRGIYALNIWEFIFGVDILPFAGIAIIVIALLKPMIEKHFLMTLCLIIIIVLLGSFLPNYVPENKVMQYVSAFFYGSVKWSYFPLFPWLAYPLTGVLCYQLQQKINFSFLNTLKTRLIVFIVFSLFFIVTMPYAINLASNLQNYYHHNLLFFAWVIAFLSLYTFFIHVINTAIKTNMLLNYLKWLGKNVTLIYVIQWLIIGNIATDIYKTIGSSFYLGLSFAAIVTVTSILVFYILKLRLKKL